MAENFQNQMSSMFSSFSSQLKPLSSQLNAAFVSTTQQVREQLVKGEVTEMPSEYLALEARVERVRIVHEGFLKVSKNYITPGMRGSYSLAYDYQQPALDKISFFASSVGSQAAELAGTFSSDAGRVSGVASPSHSAMTPQSEGLVLTNLVPPSLSHAFAKVAFQSADLVGQEDPFGAALKKFGNTMERVGIMND